MVDCLKCTKSAAYSFRVLEVRTLHVRDITGEKRVQALGEFKDYAVCKSCAADHLESVKCPTTGTIRRCTTFAVILVLGLMLTAIFWRTIGALRLMGLAAIVCGVFGLIATIQSAKKHQQIYDGLNTDQALRLAAWEILLENAPKKSVDADLTYIPINEKNLAAKNGDLMIWYDLLPEIAIEAHRLLHEHTAQSDAAAI